MFDDEEDVLVEVKIVSRHGGSVLLEWIDSYGALKRGYLPPLVIQEDGYVAQKELDAAHPYGIPWSEIIELHATPELMGEKLNRVGIWTYDDLINNAQGAIGALQSVYMVDYSVLRKIAKQHDQGDK